MASASPMSIFVLRHIYTGQRRDIRRGLADYPRVDRAVNDNGAADLFLLFRAEEPAAALL